MATPDAYGKAVATDAKLRIFRLSHRSPGTLLLFFSTAKEILWKSVGYFLFCL